MEKTLVLTTQLFAWRCEQTKKREMELTNLLFVAEKQRQQTGKQLQQTTELWKLSWGSSAALLLPPPFVLIPLLSPAISW